VAPSPWEGETGSPRVVVTIAPLDSFVKAVGGNDVAVRCLCTTTGPHHYQNDSTDARLLPQADVFFAVGLTLDDHFADRMHQDSGNPRLRYVKLGDQLGQKLLRELPNPIHHGDHVHKGYDPHVWLGLEQAERMVKEIADELSRVAPDRAETFKANAVAYCKKLEDLQKEGEKELTGKSSRRIITQHDSLHYFARSFGLEIAGVLQKAAGDEPTSQDYIDLYKMVEKSRKDGGNQVIRVIAVEPQYPKNTSAATLKDMVEKGALKLVEIDPLETADPQELKSEGAEWYLKRMRTNLNALAADLP
jgi:zinc transport system substrate-binding protein